MDERLTKRFWEVDLLRGIAIVLMVLYHIAFDLDYFGILKIDATSGFLLTIARIIVALFLLLVGLSLSLSFSRAGRLGQESQFAARLVWRSAWILSLALGITGATYLLIGRGYIVFGALHLIGLSLLLAYPFLDMGWKNFILGLILIILGLQLPSISVEHYWLLWLGLSPPGFYSLDYVPLLPWFGVVLLGIAIGELLYADYRRRVSLKDLPDLSRVSWVRSLCFLGRNSLAVYLIHQPLIIVLLVLSGYPIG